MSQGEDSKDKLLFARYGSQDIPQNMIWNDQIEALLSHRSVRAYLSDAVPTGVIESMIAAAQSASTSSNLQQWSVVVVTDKALKADLAHLAAGANGQGNPYIEEAPVLLLWVADLARNKTISLSGGGEPEVYRYVDSFLMASIDAALAAQNATVAAESLGLGTVYIGAMRNKAKEVAALINLPEFSFVTFGLVVGWPDPQRSSAIRPRLTQKAVWHQNKYDPSKLKEHVDRYEEVFQHWREMQDMKVKTWRSWVQALVSDMGYMDGRENLRTTLTERGISLL